MLQCGFVRSNLPLAISIFLRLHFVRLSRGTHSLIDLSAFAAHPRWLAEPKPQHAAKLERVKGIEPSSSAWKAVALPLSYTRFGTQNSEHGYRSGARPFLIPVF